MMVLLGGEVQDCAQLIARLPRCLVVVRPAPSPSAAWAAGKFHRISLTGLVPVGMMPTMDGSVWVGAIFGVGGTIIGGGLSLWATVIAQRQQTRASRQLVIAQRTDTAVDSAIQMFFQIKQHVRGRPSEFQEEAQQRIDVWQRSLQQ
ncbi:hypothetical protein RKD37_001090 [Streptomyces ambofaciens]